MSRTAKWEHPSDSYRQNARDERKARPAGRLIDVVQEELDAEEIEWWMNATPEVIEVDDGTWDWLNARLEEEPPVNEKLTALLRTPTVFDRPLHPLDNEE